MVGYREVTVEEVSCVLGFLLWIFAESENGEELFIVCCMLLQQEELKPNNFWQIIFQTALFEKVHISRQTCLIEKKNHSKGSITYKLTAIVPVEFVYDKILRI